MHRQQQRLIRIQPLRNEGGNHAGQHIAHAGAAHAGIAGFVEVGFSGTGDADTIRTFQYHTALEFPRFSVDYDHLLSAFANHVVLVLNPRAVDYPMDNFRSAATKMTAALLGGTLESMQLWDILRSVDYLVDGEKLNLSSISVYGRKQMGALALHAAAMDNRVSRVILEDPPGSHWQGPALLNVLRITDLPEVAALVAPREIVSLTPLPEAYRYTNAIFGLHGKSSRIREVKSLAEALRVWEY